MPYLRSIAILCLFSVTLLTSCKQKEDLLDQEERQWLNDHPNLIAAINPTFAPYQFINEQGEIDGIFIGFINLIEDRIGYTFKKKRYYNWNDIIIDAEHGKVDVILEIQETIDRGKFLTFSNPLLSQPHVIVTHKEIPSNKSLKFFDEQRIGVIKGYAIEEFLKKNHPKFELIAVSNDDEAYRMLENKEINAIISFQAIANYFINQRGYKNLKVNKSIPYLNQSSIANLREHYILSNIIDKAIRSITSKEKKQIFDSWSYTLVKPIYQKNWFWFSLLGIISGFLLLIIFINNLLKNKVKTKTLELIAAKEKAEESSQLKTAFLHNISHEIRTPVNAVVGFSDMIEKGIIKKEEHPKFLKVIKHSGEQLINVIDDLLEISSLDTKKAKVHPSEVNVSEILEELCAIYEVKAIQKEINLKLKESDKISAITDGSKLRKIISGLVDNAIKNTDKGSVEILVNTVDKSLIFQVIDTGKGIPESLLPSIFKRFQKSSHEIKNYDDGVGLGLAIIKENVELLKGSIKVSSSVNVGSNFTVSIPFTAAKENLEQQCNGNHQSLSTLEIKTVLIAEDGKLNFIVLKRLLMKLLGEDLQILHAENGQLAVEMASKTSNIDLILMDIKMPIMDGYEATKIITENNKSSLIIAQTAYATPDDQQLALDAGCKDVITKPIKMDDLKAIILKNCVSDQL